MFVRSVGMMVVAVAALLVPAEAIASAATCPGITFNNVTAGGPTRRTAQQNRSAMLNCVSVSPVTSAGTPAGQAGGSLDCQPGANLGVSKVNFVIFAKNTNSALTPAQNPFTMAECVFKNCGTCSQFTVRMADGLPVELMEFSVDDGEPDSESDSEEASGD